MYGFCILHLQLKNWKRLWSIGKGPHPSGMTPHSLSLPTEGKKRLAKFCSSYVNSNVYLSRALRITLVHPVLTKNKAADQTSNFRLLPLSLSHEKLQK